MYGDLDLDAAPKELCKDHVRSIQHCLYCRQPLDCLTDPNSFKEAVQTCPRCGWWLVSRDATILDMPPDDPRPFRPEHTRFRYRLQRAWGTLKNLDLADISLPLNELQQVLLADYSKRGKVHPRRFEDLVGSVFGNTGFTVRVTAYSGDDGLDATAVLDGDNDTTVGFQVKRYGAKIKPEQIRAFAGALLLAGDWRGIFVTTSSFTEGAQHTAERFAERGMKLELYDADRFYDRLGMAQRPVYTTPDTPDAPWYDFYKRNKEMPSLWEGWGPE